MRRFLEKITSKVPEATGRRLLIGAFALFAFVFVLLSYIYANQPSCPVCSSYDRVTYTFKSYEIAPEEKLELIWLGPMGICHHKGRFSGDNASHFCWYCFRCQKRIIKPANWRYKGSS
ncbi:MAG: hypothetical protein K8F91_04330 [Candidatus Obscuribacterales bacterium]|nr:hypothetical protein [Candidatus Obscuribacterales bacterium]